MVTEQEVQDTLMADKDEIARQLRAAATWCEKPCGECKACEQGEEFDCHANSPTSIDVRLQYVDGGWSLHAGDSQYDQDHRGYWASSSVMANLTPADAIELTMQLINEVLEDLCASQ